MSFRTPYKTRLQTKREHQGRQTHCEEARTSPNEKDVSVSDSRKTYSSSSVAIRKRLELEAARKNAEIELAKMEIQKSLIDKELEANLAELESEKSIHRSIQRSVISRTEMVEKWIRTDSEAMRGGVSVHKANCHDPQPLPLPLSPPPPAQHTDLKDLAAALRDAITSAAAPKNPNQELLTRLATSKDLPIYFGDPLEWLQFKNAFYESTDLCNYSDTENMWRLRKALRGEAREVVSALLMTNSSPCDIIATLELRFGRPEIIMNKILSHLKKLSPLSQQAYHGELIQFSIKIKNYVTAASAISQDDYLRSPELVNIIISKLPTALISKWADYYNETQTIERSKLEKLSSFLYEEARKIATCGVSFIHNQPDYRRRNEHVSSQHKVYSVCEIRDEKCRFCKTGKHTLDMCNRFKKALRKDRWRFVRVKRLCLKCLGAQHTDKSTCTAPECDIEDCGLPHHRLLHWKKPSNHLEEPLENAGESKNETIALLRNQCLQTSKVFLKIVPVTIHGSKGSMHTHALLDDGSTVTLIAADIANKVGLHGESVTMRARSAFDTGELVCKTEIIDLDISNSYDERFHLRARKINELELPTQKLSNVDFSKYEFLNNNYGLKLCECDTQPKLLIGQDNYHLIAPIMYYKGKSHEPYVTKCLLGWCVHGTLDSNIDRKCVSDRFITNLKDLSCDSALTSSSPRFPHSKSVSSSVSRKHFESNTIDSKGGDFFACHTTFHSGLSCDSSLELHEIVRKFFLLESIGVGNKPRRNKNELRAIEMLESTSILIDGQWTVGLPWKSNDTTMPRSYNSALVRLKSVMKKMAADKMYAVRYQDRINHLLENNYARTVNADEKARRVWYLPHFGVDNPNKKKLRLVFDAAAKVEGHCLNDFLLQGPDMLNSLYGVMYRFREFPIAVVGDIKDMFLRIKIQREDQHALRFLWMDKSKKIQEYAMTSLIFGANCSPFVAQYINQMKNASRFQDEMPDAVNAIQKNQYMDDYIDSMKDVTTAKELVTQVFHIHQKGGFLMRNWMSNNLDALKGIVKEHWCEDVEKIMLNNSPERTLGLMWYPSTDTIGFDLSLKRIPNDILSLVKKPTKRELLRIVMSIFDIQGFLGPITIKGKIIMQEAWKLELKWDKEIDNDLFHRFRNWLLQLKKVSEFRIPRFYFSSTKNDGCTKDRETKAASESELRLELHVFCDASPQAYAAVAYWRQVSKIDAPIVSFICSKSRVTPMSKTVSIPRLELQGALLACRLADSIKQEHRLKPSSVYFWTDSTIVLHWIRNENRNYKIFIANRLGEIDELSKIREWHYIPSKVNIADLATKDTDYELKSYDEWFTGPLFLHQDESCWPKEPETKIKICKEMLESTVTVVFEKKDDIASLPVPAPRRFSKWLRLLRATATVLLFVEKCKRSPISIITDELMRRGEVLLLRNAQTESFKTDVDLIKQQKTLKADSKLRKLSPIIDSDGLLRIEGRIAAADQVGEDVKSPIILDGQNYTVRLIVEHYHVNAGHSCNELVVNELRQKYWLIRLRPTVRSIAFQCYVCRIRKAKPKPPRLGDLPEARLTHHKRPFTACGVDLFGPMQVAVGRQRVLRYGVLFSCLTVRAIHIEIVSDLTADALIMALRRMASRRGWPRTIYSDNGTNMRGAAKELKTAFRELDQEAVSTQAVNKGVDWRFIPPVSPHMGGAWERLIRSVKDALKVVLKERSPREEVLFTLFTEIENMVNSRPLTQVSVDPCTQEALTPNHFLIGSSSNLPQPGVFDDGDVYLRKQWRIAQRLADLFWGRWLKEVLPSLVPRHKWHTEGAQLSVGDLVVVVDPSSPRNHWPKGVITAVYAGKDGRVRVADIKTKAGVLKRPATRIALMFKSK